MHICSVLVAAFRRKSGSGSTGSLPVVLGSLPSTILAGKLPAIAGWQPALPGKDAFSLGGEYHAS
ncbi:MAG TPA: hypothetical protein VJ719_02285 [Chthoniobacterales bacterium]|nr:hypothetical protein [Chthoniobacterales bacterium]